MTEMRLSYAANLGETDKITSANLGETDNAIHFVIM